MEECPSNFVETISKPMMTSTIDSMHAIDGIMKSTKACLLLKDTLRKREMIFLLKVLRCTSEICMH